MSAGAIATPQIIPLRPPMLGTSSFHIDTNTFIEIKSDSLGVEIFYTTNGTKPDPFHRVLNKTTAKYKRPFNLREGKRTIKAVAVTKNGLHESQIVTKTFQVDPGPDLEEPNYGDDDRSFQFVYNKKPTSFRPRSRSPPFMFTRPRSRSPSPVLRRSSDMGLDLQRMHLSEHRPIKTDSGFYSSGVQNGYDFIGEPPASRTISVPVYPTSNVMSGRDADFYNKQVVMAGHYPSKPSVADPQYWMNGKPLPTSQIDSNTHVNWSDTTLSVPVHTLDKQSIGTQTTGLVFPSPEQVHHMRAEVEELHRLRAELRRIKEEKKPQLTDVSAGRGYWQKQLNHICEHIKAFTEENAEFRAAIAEPKLTRIIGGAVEEEADEFSVTVTFRKMPTPSNIISRPCQTHKHVGTGPRYFATREREYFSDDGSSIYSNRSADSARSRKRRVVKKNKKNPVPRWRKTYRSEERERERTHEEKLRPEERLLLKEVSAKGDGNPDEVQHLLDEGADPNTENNDGVPLLGLAVINEHIDCIQVLVENEAKVNQKFGKRENTVLHEAVQKGPKAKKLIQTLLDYKANPQIQNKKGKSAYDMSVEAGHDIITKLFVSNVGYTLMDRMTRKFSDVQKNKKELDLEGF